MKTRIFFIAMLCLMLVSLQGAMLVNAKMGSITFHVFKDMDDDKMFDANESSPPWTVIKLKMQGNYPIFYFLFNRLRLVGGSGDVTCRFIRYPCDYHLVAHYEYSPDGLGMEFWYYESPLHLDAENIGSTIYIPLKGGYVP
jgi:hypothetical protein